jgi:hypothetical protein
MIRTPVLEKATNASSVQGLSSHHEYVLLLLLMLLLLLLYPHGSHKNNKSKRGSRRNNNNNNGKNCHQNDRSYNSHDAIVVLLRLIWTGQCPKTSIISAPSQE